MTGTLTFYDAAWPPAHPPVADGVCIYIGGDTPHVWSLADIASQKARYRLPIFVRSNPPGPGAAADAASAVAALHSIGAPRGTLGRLGHGDCSDAAYIRAVYGDLNAAGYKLIVYGTQSTVMGNDNPDGLYWGADWTDVPHFAWHNVITQWVSVQRLRRGPRLIRAAVLGHPAVATHSRLAGGHDARTAHHLHHPEQQR